eukprot:03763_1
MSITSIIMSVCSLWLQLPFQFFHQQLFWQELQRIRHDDPAVVLAAPASMRAPWGARWRLELVALVSFHSCHTRQFCYERRPDSTLDLFNLYRRRSVLAVSV